MERGSGEGWKRVGCSDCDLTMLSCEAGGKGEPEGGVGGAACRTKGSLKRRDFVGGEASAEDEDVGET